MYGGLKAGWKLRLLKRSERFVKSGSGAADPVGHGLSVVSLCAAGRQTGRGPVWFQRQSCTALAVGPAGRGGGGYVFAASVGALVTRAACQSGDGFLDGRETTRRRAPPGKNRRGPDTDHLTVFLQLGGLFMIHATGAAAVRSPGHVHPACQRMRPQC